MENKYIIDSNIFITAHRLIYPFDIAPSFWGQIIEKASDKIIIIEKVQKMGQGDRFSVPHKP